MSMVRKILKGVAKGLLYLVIFIALLIFVVLPLAAPWLIERQGSKLLKHPVEVRSVFFNPFVFRVTVNRFSISDAGKQPMVGFKKLWVNASFLALLKKEIRVQSIGLEDLLVNAELLPGGRVNLLELAPPPAPAPAVPSAEAAPAAPTDPAAASKPMPVVFVDEVVLRNGTIRFVDRTVEPNFQTSVSKMQLSINGISTMPDAQVRAAFQAALGEQTTMSVEAQAKPLAQPIALEAAFLLSGYDLQTFTPYVGKYAGRGVKDGRLDVKLDYLIADNQLRAGHQVLVQHFDFGQKVESKDALNLPFGLAVALLEDPQGRIDISLPVKGDISDPEFEYFHLVGQVARNFFTKLVTKPLGVLASLAGASGTETEESGYIKFAPGSPELTDETKERLRAVVKGLKERPKLLLEINGSYDPQADWQAIRARTYEATYAAMREESRRSDSQLLKYMYEDFFGLLSYGKLSETFKDESGKVDQERLDAEAKRRLLEEAPADQAALSALAAARAQVVHEFMIAEGFDPARVSVGASRETQGSMGQVPLEFSLTVVGGLPEPA